MPEIVTVFECTYCGNRYISLPLIGNMIHCFGCGCNKIEALTLPGRTEQIIPVENPVSSYFVSNYPNSRYFYRDHTIYYG